MSDSRKSLSGIYWQLRICRWWTNAPLGRRSCKRQRAEYPIKIVFISVVCLVGCLSVSLYPHHFPPPLSCHSLYGLQMLSISLHTPFLLLLLNTEDIQSTGRFTFDIGKTLHVYILHACEWGDCCLTITMALLVTLSAERLFVCFLKKMCLFCCYTNRPNMYWLLWDCTSSMITGSKYEMKMKYDSYLFWCSSLSPRVIPWAMYKIIWLSFNYPLIYSGFYF